MNRLLEHLLMWCPFVGLILSFSYTPWVDKYLYNKGNDLRNFLCIVLWQGGWFAVSLVAFGYVLGSELMRVFGL